MAFSTSASGPSSEEQYFMFGPYKVYHKEVFHTTHLTFAMVNLRPLLPVKRFIDLTSEEATDLWLTAHKVGGTLEDHYQASSLTFTIQDGPEAGQTVPHVHIHILPRKAGDFMRRNGKNDCLYDAIDEKEKELKQGFDLDIVRKDRSWEERTQEAHVFQKLFP
ncbi:hypothetical protein MKW98_010395 [Papaver atlanticum]|uniref:HIT domain-containing protein n=1 Tax=Papaver atlanticum TaxID=357466 RepID=A0AAD4XGZ8_9MAGN|nr:hypothetical protein MKW98_010395 [Papaver atlanticum]